MFNRAMARYLANPTPANLARVCAILAGIEAKFKNAPGKPTPMLPPGVVCPPPAPRGNGRGGGAGGGGGGGGGGAGGGMAGGNAQPGGAPARPFGFIRNFNPFACDYSWVVTADPNNPAGFTVMNPTGTINVPAMSTEFVMIEIEIVALTLTGTTADFDISWTEDCTGLPVIDDMDHFRVTALDDVTFEPVSPGVVLPPGVPTTISWTLTNHTPIPQMKSYSFTSTVDYYSIGALNSGLPYGIGNVFLIDKSVTGGMVVVPPLTTVGITATVGDNTAGVDKGPLIDGEFCDPEMLNCCGLMIDKVESVVLMFGDASFPSRDSAPAYNLSGVAAGGGVALSIMRGTSMFTVNVPTFPGQPIPEILDQLGQQLVNRSKIENMFDFLPIVDESGIEVLRSPDTTVQFLSFDPGLEFIPDTWADFDKDGDVDTGDFAQFAQCFSGPGSPFPLPPICTVYSDFDNDSDVDTSDFAQFAQCFGGSGQPPPPGCGLQ